jgi:uncharacterized protein (TIGR02145 family)
VLGVSSTDDGYAKSIVFGCNDEKVLAISGATVNEAIEKNGSVVLKIRGESAGIATTNTSSFAGGNFTDARDGKEYVAVKIGDQVWMANNLDYESRNSSCDQCEPYGRLYTFDDAKNVCPSGWHLPSETEWKALSTSLGGDNIAGGKMKEAGTDHWKKPNVGATNASGFNGLPGGGFSEKYIFKNDGDRGYFWASQGFDAFYARCIVLSYDKSDIIFDKQLKLTGFSVRCVKD